MDKRVLKQIVLVAALLLMGCHAQAQNESYSQRSWLSNKPKKLNIELKAGRGFLSGLEGTDGSDARVFYGGGNMSYGFMLSNNFVGLGVGAEYYSMMEGSFDFPVFLNFHHYFSKDAEKGVFVGAKVGYMFAGKKSIPTVEEMLSGDMVNASRERSMKGLFWEVAAGYRFSNLSLSVSYNYRVIGYETILYPENAPAGIPYNTYSRTMHTVMAGVSFMLF